MHCHPAGSAEKIFKKNTFSRYYLHFSGKFALVFIEVLYYLLLENGVFHSRLLQKKHFSDKSFNSKTNAFMHNKIFNLRQTL